MRSTALIVVVLLAACGNKSAPSPTAAADGANAPSASAPVAGKPASAESGEAANTATLSAEGVGRVKFGATLAEVEKALAEQPIAPVPQGSECTTVQFKSLPQLYFMVEKGVVTRADARDAVPNITGVGLGDAPGVLTAKYPKIIVGPHKYLDAGHYLTLPGKGDTAMVFEDDGSKITAVRAGKQPSVAYVEGCG